MSRRIYNSLIVQDLWEANYKILLTVSVEEFIKLNANVDMIIKNEICGIKFKDCKCCLEYTNIKDDLKVVSATFVLVCFLVLNESTCQTKKNVFYFTSKALFVLEKIKS